MFFFFKQKTAYELRISDWSSDGCSSDLVAVEGLRGRMHDHVEAELQRPLDPGCGKGVVAGSEDAALAGEGRDGLQIDQLQQRIGRCLDPDEPGFRAHRRFQALQARHVDEAEVEARRSEEHTSELQSLMRISYAVFC